jgi:hypothetical protein
MVEVNMTNDTQSGTDTLNPAADSGRRSGDTTLRSRDLRGQAGEAVAKLTDAAQQAGQQAKESVSSLASETNEKAKGMLNEQIARGAGLVAHIADSIDRAADHLGPEAPQIAGFIRGAAGMSKDLSRNLQDKSVDELFRSASDFARRQPAVVFGAAALFGFFAFRLLKIEPASASDATGMAATKSREPASAAYQPSNQAGSNFHGT